MQWKTGRAPPPRIDTFMSRSALGYPGSGRLQPHGGIGLEGTPLLWHQAGLIRTLHRAVLPLVEQEWSGWWRRALCIPQRELRIQALSSLRYKRFHCAGGSVYATAVPGPVMADVVAAVCALQILVDYLDNLADRTGQHNRVNLAALHEAVDDALTPGGGVRDYYRHHPHREDGGYLGGLVRACQSHLDRLPGLTGDRLELVRRFGAGYARLQVLKHLPPAEREAELINWLAPALACFPGVNWWELAAACGSTLGIFATFQAAASRDGPTPDEVAAAYFPWIGGLHILLDYYVDQQEDRAGGDLNFVSYYPDTAALVTGLARMHDEAARRAGTLPQQAVHRLVVAGLPGMYLSDPKVAAQRLRPQSRRLVARAGPAAVASYLYWRWRPPGR